jgi:hypothetical protein
LHKNHFKANSPPLRYQNNNIALTTQEKIYFFAKNFAYAFEPNNIYPNNYQHFQVNQFISLSLHTSYTTPGEILLVVKKLNNNNSPGHDLLNKKKTVRNMPPKTIIIFTYIFIVIFCNS